MLDKSFDVLMPQFGSVYRVYCKVSKQCVMGSHDHDFFQDLPLQSFHFEVIEETQLTCLHLVWSDESVPDKSMQAQVIPRPDHLFCFLLPLLVLFLIRISMCLVQSTWYCLLIRGLISRYNSML